MVAVSGVLMSGVDLSALKLSESSQPSYPKLRLRAACSEWGTQMSLCLAQNGCAAVLLLWRTDLMAIDRSDRDKCEKIFGSLLSGRGPLREQPGLRQQLQVITRESPAMYLHGPRLFAAMVTCHMIQSV